MLPSPAMTVMRIDRLARSTFARAVGPGLPVRSLQVASTGATSVSVGKPT